MALEADFSLIDNGERFGGIEEVLPPGTYKKYDDYPGISAFINADNTRSVLQLEFTDGVFAIHFLDEADQEGEILWLGDKNIELTVGQEVWIGVNSRVGKSQEIWFTHTTDGELITSKFTIDDPARSGL